MQKKLNYKLIKNIATNIDNITTEFDNVLFAMLVDRIIVYKDKTLEMVWRGNA